MLILPVFSLKILAFCGFVTLTFDFLFSKLVHKLMVTRVNFLLILDIVFCILNYRKHGTDSMFSVMQRVQNTAARIA